MCDFDTIKLNCADGKPVGAFCISGILPMGTPHPFKAPYAQQCVNAVPDTWKAANLRRGTNYNTNSKRPAPRKGMW